MDTSRACVVVEMGVGGGVSEVVVVVVVENVVELEVVAGHFEMIPSENVNASFLGND